MHRRWHRNDVHASASASGLPPSKSFVGGKLVASQRKNVGAYSIHLHLRTNKLNKTATYDLTWLVRDRYCASKTELGIFSYNAGRPPIPLQRKEMGVFGDAIYLRVYSYSCLVKNSREKFVAHDNAAMMLPATIIMLPFHRQFHASYAAVTTNPTRDSLNQYRVVYPCHQKAIKASPPRPTHRIPLRNLLRQTP